ncbi:hypothetical protein ACP275_09G059700 [Erythranthe tilingii]
MAEESEKRFEAIMNKLFHSPPKPKPNFNSTSRHGVQTLSGRKRLHSSSLRGGNVVQESGISSAQGPLCRPWDRDDLLRRLSTFKSMSWFAKPQVVSPLECARRGWVNVDMDTIACASCDSRLFFSTPSTWTRQQVEKAAMVFSLKLESGHKLLCPWTNSACEEELAQFPILSSDGLIEDYKKRFFSLSQLTALPVISQLAIDNMSSSELEKFLSESSASGHHEPLPELTEDVPESLTSVLYYQAQKLISLFGWEPRIKPYKVDFKDGHNQSVENAGGIATTGQKPKVNVYSLLTSEGTNASSDPEFDPSSVVLDCKLCGASVGLWAFKTTPRPLEYLRFVGLTEVTDKSITIHDEGSSGTVSTASTSSGFTIAGGPPPAMLKYGATISVPLIGQNLRARLSVENETNNAEGTSDFTARNLLEVLQSVGEDSISNVDLSKSGTAFNAEVGDHHKFDNAQEVSCSSPKENTPSRESGGVSEPVREEMVEAGNHEQGIPSSSLDNPTTGLSVKHKAASFSIREDKQLPSLYDSMEFDPVKQHRHFCPWIISTGKFAPGWKQTLSALEGHKEHINMPSSNLIEVDDPVTSVRNLFRSPNEKRTKFSGGSA